MLAFSVERLLRPGFSCYRSMMVGIVQFEEEEKIPKKIIPFCCPNIHTN